MVTFPVAEGKNEEGKYQTVFVRLRDIGKCKHPRGCGFHKIPWRVIRDTGLPEVYFAVFSDIIDNAFWNLGFHPDDYIYQVEKWQ